MDPYERFGFGVTNRVRVLAGASAVLALFSMGMILIFGERYPAVIWGGLALFAVAFVAVAYCAGAAFSEVQSPSRSRERDRDESQRPEASAAEQQSDAR